MQKQVKIKLVKKYIKIIKNNKPAKKEDKKAAKGSKDLVQEKILITHLDY